MNLLVEIFLTIPVKLIARFDARIGVQVRNDGNVSVARLP